MAAKRPRIIVPPTIEEKIEKAISSWHSFSSTPTALQPKPTRTFSVGEEVVVGNLKNVFIEKILDEDGMSYVYRCDWKTRDTPLEVQYRAEWWFNIEKKVDTMSVPQLMTPYRLFPATSSDISSLIHHLNSGGLVCDPTYQRDYVWTDENKDALIDSIFERLDIGAFLLIRHAGFNHTDASAIRTYRTLDGDLVQIPATEDYTTAIIDGQQRLTTIVQFMLDKRPYRGVYFSQLNGRDKQEFENHTVQFRIIEEEKVSRKEVLRMFLQSNRGVPQSPEHIAKVQAMYDAES